MTRKDYRAVAKIVQALAPIDGPLGKSNDTRKLLHWKTAHAFAEKFAKNSNFDRVKFLTACGVEE